MGKGRQLRFKEMDDDILEILEDETLTTQDVMDGLIQKDYEITWRTVKSYLDSLEKDNRIQCTKVGRAYIWKGL